MSPMKPKTFGASRTEANRKAYDRNRADKAGREWYRTARWQRNRTLFLAKHPLCVECEKDNKITVATDVDHIVPHKGDYEKFWDAGNWSALCHACHSRKTRRGE